MPELKHTFTGGKMEKDKDERIVPNGQYREALNISVSTSEDSDVGAAQNILGNIVVTQATKGRTQTNTTITGLVNSEHTNYNSHIAEIIDPQSDALYRFISTENNAEGVWMDRVVEYDTTKRVDVPWQEKENSVMVDIYRVRVNLNASTKEKLCVDGTGSKWRVKPVTGVDQPYNNLNQLRWGMKVRKTNDKTCYIEHIDYVNGWIYMDGIGDTTDDMFHGNVNCYGDRSLNFSKNRTITGINIIDGMLFWTDNYSEPKKIDIKRCKQGSNTSLWATTPGLIGRYSGLPIPKIDDFNQHTVLVVKDSVKYDCAKNAIICDDGSGYRQTTTIDDLYVPDPIILDDNSEDWGGGEPTVDGIK